MPRERPPSARCATDTRLGSFFAALDVDAAPRPVANGTIRTRRIAATIVPPNLLWASLAHKEMRYATLLSLPSPRSVVWLPSRSLPASAPTPQRLCAVNSSGSPLSANCRLSPPPLLSRKGGGMSSDAWAGRPIAGSHNDCWPSRASIQTPQLLRQSACVFVKAEHKQPLCQWFTGGAAEAERSAQLAGICRRARRSLPLPGSVKIGAHLPQTQKPLAVLIANGPHLLAAPRRPKPPAWSTERCGEGLGDSFACSGPS